MPLQIKLLYLGSNVTGYQSNSPFGYNEVKGVEKYFNASLRNVRVVRVDLLQYLTEHFTVETVKKYRNVLYYILAGYGKEDNMDLISQSLETLYKEDEVFRIKMGKIFYFRDSEYANLSVYDTLLRDVRVALGLAWNTVLKNVPYIKVVCDSHLYLYLSVSQSVDVRSLLSIPGLEVVSK